MENTKMNVGDKVYYVYNHLKSRDDILVEFTFYRYNKFIITEIIDDIYFYGKPEMACYDGPEFFLMEEDMYFDEKLAEYRVNILNECDSLNE